MRGRFRKGAALQFQGLRRFEERAFSAERVALYAAAVLACYALFVAKGYFERLWLIDTDGSGKALDFVAIWAAARLALAGQAAAAYDFAVFTRAQLTGVATLGGEYHWAYPPTYFLMIAPLALFSYPAAGLIWLFGTIAAYVAAIRAILPRWPAVLAALASPFVLWNFLAGQNGFLTAALIGFVLALLDRAPVAAGILLGLLTWKPQLGLLFPLVLLLTGRRRTFVAAGASTLLMAALSYFAFGRETWAAFFEALHGQAGVVLDRGDVGFQKLQSMHALVRLLGGGDALAWSLHIAAALAATVLTCRVWLRPVDYRLKAASLATASLIATPYLFIYDLPILSVPVAFLASAGLAQGFLPGERTVTALLVPLLLLLPGQPVGVPLLALLMLLIVLRLRRQAPAL
jgi:hypothetical protein